MVATMVPIDAVEDAIERISGVKRLFLLLFGGYHNLAS